MSHKQPDFQFQTTRSSFRRWGRNLLSLLKESPAFIFTQLPVYKEEHADQGPRKKER